MVGIVLWKLEVEEITAGGAGGGVGLGDTLFKSVCLLVLSHINWSSGRTV